MKPSQYSLAALPASLPELSWSLAYLSPNYSGHLLSTGKKHRLPFHQGASLVPRLIATKRTDMISVRLLGSSHR